MQIPQLPKNPPAHAISNRIEMLIDRVNKIQHPEPDNAALIDAVERAEAALGEAIAFLKQQAGEVK